jgi:hypothetical protein
MDMDEVREILQSAGRDLARINSIPVAGFGWVERETDIVADPLSAPYENFEVMVKTEYLPAIEALAGDALPGAGKAHLKAAACTAIQSSNGPGEARLAHGDFDTSHIFVHESRYSGIIDFGEIRRMLLAYDLAHHLMHDREWMPYSTIDWLIEGYRDVRPLPADVDARIAA